MAGLGEASRMLRLLGLGEREVAIYLALVERGPLTARELSEALGIPYTKVYLHLRRLEESGLVAGEAARPHRYRARPPSEVYRLLVSKASEALRIAKGIFDGLQAIYEARHPDATPTFLTLLRGAERVREMVKEVLTSAEGEAYLALPFRELATYDLLAVLETESRRIPIKVLITEGLSGILQLPPRVEVRALAEMFGGGVIGSAAVLYVRYGDDVAGIYSNERYLIEIARTYFRHLWDRASPM